MWVWSGICGLEMCQAWLMGASVWAPVLLVRVIEYGGRWLMIQRLSLNGHWFGVLLSYVFNQLSTKPKIKNSVTEKFSVNWLLPIVVKMLSFSPFHRAETLVSTYWENTVVKQWMTLSVLHHLKTQGSFTVGVCSSLPDTCNNILSIVSAEKSALFIIFWLVQCLALYSLFKPNSPNDQTPNWINSPLRKYIFYEISDPKTLLIRLNLINSIVLL